MSIRSRAPKASSPAVRKVMQSVRSEDTSAELLLRRALHAVGLRYRKETRPEPDLRCKGDVVFYRQKVCIFADGCFWHGCPIHFRAPKTNTRWWEEKIADNANRDLRQTEVLQARGWKIIRLWEHEVNSNDLPLIVDNVVSVVRNKDRN